MTRIYHLRNNAPSIPPVSPQLAPDFSMALKPLSLSARSHTLLTPRLEASHSVPYVERQPATLAPRGLQRLHDMHAQNSQDYFMTKARLLLRAGFENRPSRRIRELEESLDSQLYAVRFTWSETVEHSVFLIGSFNGWGAPIAMQRKADADNKEHVWECVVRLPAGEYRYKYVVDGQLRVDGERVCEHVASVPIANKLIIEEMDTG